MAKGSVAKYYYCPMFHISGIQMQRQMQKSAIIILSAENRLNAFKISILSGPF
jgi:hypothetical protein